MCPGFRCQQTNSPEVDARENETGTPAGRERQTAGKTATRTKQVRTDYQSVKELRNRPFSLATSFSKTALRTADREPMGGFLRGLLFSVNRSKNYEYSQEI